MRVGSFLQLQSETAWPGWQRLTGWSRRISDDALVYALERYDLQDLRQVLVDINKTLKRNKALESAKINDCWWSLWMPTNSSIAGIGVVRPAASAPFRSKTRTVSCAR